MRGARWLLGGLAATLVVLAAPLPSPAKPQGVAGKVTNQFELINPVWAEARDLDKHLYSFRELVPTVPEKYRRPYPDIAKEVCIAALASGPVEASPKPTTIVVGGGRTIPVTIVVPIGTRLRFQNSDPFAHRLYQVGAGAVFKAQDQPAGQPRELSVQQPGVVEIRDELAPSLRMWIVAEPKAAAIIYPLSTGEFTLSVPSPGDYTVQAYFAGKPVGPATPVQVGEVKGKKETVELKGAVKLAPDPKPEDGKSKN